MAGPGGGTGHARASPGHFDNTAAAKCAKGHSSSQRAIGSQRHARALLVARRNKLAGVESDAHTHRPARTHTRRARVRARHATLRNSVQAVGRRAGVRNAVQDPGASRRLNGLSRCGLLLAFGGVSCPLLAARTLASLSTATAIKQSIR
eukprot:5916754-Prymnesium_polylepis.1